jgi:hypothetical protein
VILEKWAGRKAMQSAAMIASMKDPDPARPAGAQRRRVRTPGKHIVLFALAVTFMAVVTMSALRSGKVPIPDYRLPDLAGSGAAHYAPDEQFLVDLSPDASGRVAYLKLRLKIAARDSAALAEIKSKGPIVRERIACSCASVRPRTSRAARRWRASRTNSSGAQVFRLNRAPSPMSSLKISSFSRSAELGLGRSPRGQG